MNKKIILSILGLFWALGAVAQIGEDPEDTQRSYDKSLYDRFVSGRVTSTLR